MPHVGAEQIFAENEVMVENVKAGVFGKNRLPGGWRCRGIFMDITALFHQR